MENLETKKHLDIDSYSLLTLLLPMLYNNKVFDITAEELSKKLFYYSLKSEYKELFDNISINKQEHKILLSSSMGMIKRIFNRNVLPTDDDKLSLFYHNFNLDEYFEHYDPSLCILIKKIAEELSIRYKIESYNKYNLNIYGINPNQVYSVVLGKFRNSITSWELITDGNIYNTVKMKNSTLSFEDPKSKYDEINIIKNVTKRVEILDANYTILQGKTDGHINRINIYTDILDSSALQKIGLIATNEYENCSKILSKKPSIKKVYIKN